MARKNKTDRNMKTANDYEKWLVNRAKELRETPTSAETKMMEFLREHKIHYKTQVPIIIGPKKGYIVDFVLFNKVILEIDGDIHYLEENKVKDRQRTEDLEGKGYQVIRMRNGSTTKGNIYRVLISRFEKVAPETARRLQNEFDEKEREKRIAWCKDKKAKLPDWDFKERMWDMSGGHFPVKTPKLKRVSKK